MVINDYIYGSFEIDNVLSEIIETEEIQRLKGVYQGGASVLVNEKWNVTRYEHSIGTMLLIRLLNGCIEEQIAGLIHDISHTAFSHVIDLVLDNKEEDYHESIFDNVIKSSNIPSILNKYGYDINSIMDESKWSILERKAPKLCADRVDYTLRDMYKFGKISNDEIDAFVKSLSVVDGEIVVKSIECSEWFVRTYNAEVGDYFMNPLNLYSYDKLAEAIKVCVNLGELKKSDFLKEDKDVMEILKNSNNKIVKDILYSLNSNLNVIESKEDYDIHKTTKLRFVDPTVIVNGDCIESSKISNEIVKMNLKLKEKVKDGIFIKRI
ncbi:MAG: HD domain-containing protein [Peptostreptococcaceae bacterium]